MPRGREILWIKICVVGTQPPSPKGIVEGAMASITQQNPAQFILADALYRAAGVSSG